MQFNKKRIIAILVFLLLSFFMMTFGNPAENDILSTRDVTFIDSYDNKNLGTKTVEVGKEVEAPNVPSHDNVIFKYWCYENTEEKANLTEILENMTVETCYADDINNNGVDDDKDQRYTVTFINSMTNKTMKTQRVLVGMNATAPLVIAYNGYVFNGWTKSYTNVRSDVTTRTIYNSTVVVPEIITYKVTFIDNEDNSVIAVYEVESGATSTTPVPPKHDKRVFDYWQGNYVNVTKNEEVRAIYTDDRNENEIKDYEEYVHVRYDLNGGISLVDIEDKNDYLPSFDDITLTSLVPSRVKAVFIGWSFDKHPLLTTQAEEDAVVLVNNKFQIAEDKTLYAVWAEDSNENEIIDYKEYYKVNFVSEHGTRPADITKILYKSLVPNPGALSETGYIFDGWYKESAFSNAWDFDNDQVLEDTTIYAKWTEAIYNLKFTMNDGVVTNSVTPTNPSEYTISSEITFNNASSESHNFDGWYTLATEGVKVNGIVPGTTGDKQYYGHWTIKSYTITFIDTDNTQIPKTVNWGSNMTDIPEITSVVGKTCTWNKTIFNNIKANETVYSNCELNSYQLVVDANNGSWTGVTPQTIEYTKTSNITDPTRTGYTFDGWTLQGAGSSLVNKIFTMGYENAKITAKWNINSYSVIYDLNDDTVGNEVTGAAHTNTLNTYTIITTLYNLTNASSLSHRFDGWYDVNNNKITTLAGGETGNVTLYAHWTANEYIVDFESNGGSTVSKITGLHYNDKINKVVPTKEGYDFAGWFKEVSLTNEWNFLTDSVKKSLTLYAKWTEAIYNLKFTMNDGVVTNSVTPTNPSEYTISSEITFNNASSESHNFDGWYTLATEGVKVNGIVPGTTGDKQYYGHWTIKSYTITFIDTDNTQIPKTVNWGSNMTDIPEITSVVGKTCTWNKTIFNNIKANETVYSNCELNSYQLVVDANNGSWTGVTPQTIEYTKTSNITDPTRTGYTFDGWTLQGAGSSLVNKIFTMGYENAKITAKWNINSYSLTVNPNGGKYNNSTENTVYENVLYNSAKTIVDPTKEGYVFGGWTISGATDSTLVEKALTMGSANTTLTAIWIPANNTKYNVNHYLETLEGGYPDTPNFSKEMAGTTGENTAAEANEYEGFTAQAFTQLAIAANGSTVINIYYNRISYTLTLEKDTNVTSVTGAGTYKYGTSVDISAILKTEENYAITFAKWASSNTTLLADLEGALKAATTIEMPAGNITLTATTNRVEIVPTIELGNLVANYPKNGKQAEPKTLVGYNITVSNKESKNISVNLGITSDGNIGTEYTITYKDASGNVTTTETVTSLNNIVIPANGSIELSFSSTVKDDHSVNDAFDTKVTVKTVNNTKIDEKTSSIEVQKSASATTENAKDKNVILILDLSGSMSYSISSTDNTKRIDALEVAAQQFINKLKADATKNNTKLTLNVILIGNEQHRWKKNGSYYGPIEKWNNYSNVDAYMMGTYDLNSWIPNIGTNLKAEGGTNITGALTIAQNIIKSSTYRDNYGLKYLTTNADTFTVLLTDGANGPYGEDDDNDRIKGTEIQVEYVRNNSSLFAIGFGSDAANPAKDGYKDLLAITGSSKLIYKADSQTELDKAFNSIAQKIGEKQSVEGIIDIDLPDNGLYYPIVFSYLNNNVQTTLFTITNKSDLALYPEVTIVDKKLYWNLSGTKYSAMEGLKVELDTSSNATNGE